MDRSIAKVAIAFIALGMGHAVAAQGNVSTGNTLLEECRSAEIVMKVSCHQYIIGVLDGINMIESVESRSFDVPEGVRGAQLRDIVVKYLEANPDKRHWPSSGLVYNAIAQTFPRRD